MMIDGFNEHRSLPIPPIAHIDGRESIKILECGDPLIELMGSASTFIEVRSEYHRRGYRNAMTKIVVRQRVAHLLAKAAQSLPKGCRLLVLDGWRPLSLQQELFDEQLKSVRTRRPEASEEELRGEIQNYVSLPTEDPSAPPPHLTGGAVDVTLCDGGGNAIEMGTAFDYFGPEAQTRYFEEKLEREGRLSSSDLWFLKSRRTLYHALKDAGFSNYREEWWHYDFGNQFWAKINKTSAVYGAVYYDH